MGSKSDSKAGATAVPPLRIGKREGESEDEQVSAKKQRRNEVVEEQKNNMEIVLDGSFSDSEPDMNPEAEKASLNKQKKGKPASANCSSSLESLADRSRKDEGNMDIDEGDYSEESNEETPNKKLEILVDAALNAPECDLKNVENDSVSDTNSSDVEKSHMVTNPMKSSEISGLEIDEEASKTPQENSEAFFTPEVRQAGSKTIYTRNLSYSVERADLENLFKDCGEIVDIRLHTYPDGRFRGFGHVEFATAEAAEKALQLNNTEVLRCPIRVGLAREYTRYRSFHDNFSNSFERSERFQCGKDSEIAEDCEKESEEKASNTHQKSPKMLVTPDQQNAGWKTIYTTNLSYSVERTDLENIFKKCGEIVDILLHTYPDGRLKGYAHVVFATAEAAQKALELNNMILLGRRVGVCIAEQNAGRKTIYINNLSYSLEPTDLENHFKECGEIVDILLHTYPDGKLKGYGHVVFATTKAAQKALDLNNTVLLGRRIGVSIAEKKCDYNCNRSFHNSFSNSFERSERFQHGKVSEDFGQETEEKASKTHQKSDMEMVGAASIKIKTPKMLVTPDQQNAGWKTIYTCNLSYSLEPTDLENLFKKCGEIVDIRLHTYPDGRLRGYAHIVFATAEAAQKALELNNTVLLGRRIGVCIAEQQCDYTRKRSFHYNFMNSFEKSERYQREKGSEISEDFEPETEEKASKTLQTLGSNTVLLGRPIGVGMAEEKGECTSSRSTWSKSFYKSERNQPIKNVQCSEYSDEEIEEKASRSPWESSKRLATPMEQNAPSKTILVKNLSYSVKRADMEIFFKECGKIVDIRLHTDHEGRLNGLAHVDFATVEAAERAFELQNKEFLRRRIGVVWAREKGEYTCIKSNRSNSFQKCERNQSLTVYVKGFDGSLSEAKIKASLGEHFGSCGEITKISIAKFHDSGAVKGFAHLEFKDVDSVEKALYLDQTKLGGYPLLVEIAKPRREGQGRGGGGHQFGGRDGSGYSSSVGLGRSGGGGWHSVFYG